MVQFSNRTNLLPVRKRCKILKHSQNLSTVKTRWFNSQTEQTCHQSGKDGTILKQSQNLSPVRKRWYNTQTESKPVTSQKKMVQYWNSAKTCHQPKKMAQYSNRVSAVRKRSYNTQTEPKHVNSQKKMVQYSNRAKTRHQSEKDGTILKQCKNLSPAKKDGTILKQSQNLSAVRKRSYNTQTEPKPVNSLKKMVQFSNSAKTC